MGSWTSPDQHDFYAEGNVLAWSELLPYRRKEQLPDNFGIDWASGVYGPETIAHVIGAWQIYEHSGNLNFLEQAYSFYKELFWDGIGGNHFEYGYDSILCLNKMAEVLGQPEDAVHWNTSVDMAHVMDHLEYFWEIDTPGMFGGTGNGIGWLHIAPTGISMFPREWVETMASLWLDNPVDGFYAGVPLTSTAMKYYPDKLMEDFAVVPDANWYMIRGLYRHTVDRLANKFTLAHLKNYNMEDGIPVASEGRRLDLSRFGDYFSNFNAGKILLILEGIAGLQYSMHENSFTFSDNLPPEWNFMEVHVPVQASPGAEVTWVKTRVESSEEDGFVNKAVTVEDNPFASLIIQPWMEDRVLETASPADGMLDNPVGHYGWTFYSQSANVTLSLCAH